MDKGPSAVSRENEVAPNQDATSPPYQTAQKRPAAVVDVAPVLLLSVTALNVTPSQELAAAQAPAPPVPTPELAVLPVTDSGPILAEDLVGLDIEQPAEEQFVTTVQEDDVDMFSILPELEVKRIIRSVSMELLPEISDSSLSICPGIDVASPARIQKTYLAIQKCLRKAAGDGPTMYDRLKQSLRQVLKTSNREAYGSYEQILGSLPQKSINREMGNSQFRSLVLAEAKLRSELLKADGAPEERIDAYVNEDTGKSKLPNLLRIYPYLSNAGIPRLMTAERASILNLAFRKLLDFDAKILSVKFWGVIYGSKNDYYIAEVDTDPPDDEEDEAAEDANKTAEATEEEDTEVPEIEGFEGLPSVPKPLLKPLPGLVKEPSGSGVNRKSYYVATKLDGTWTRLPPVTPDQMINSRKIHRGFTGDLKAKVPAFPVFPGVEANYLRAQIARISAATQICPNGFFILDGEDFEEDSAPPFNLIENPEYIPLSLQELSQPHLKMWMHCGQYILRQGRTSFYDAFEANRDDDEDEEAEDENEDNTVRKPKYPVWYPEKADWYEPEDSVPPPLCSVMNDAAIDGYPPWSLHFGSKTFSNQSFIVARSNLWPGANTIVHDQGRNFFNIYFGNGLKYRSNFMPKIPGHVKHEKYDPTLHEEVDPTPEEEEDIRKAAGLDDAEGEEEEGNEETA